MSSGGRPAPARTRFAPSPTGALHLGSIRTALFAWLTARGSDGTFVLRIEDTDQARRVPGSEDQILDSLRWLGLEWDEGPDIGGPQGPYVQSQRTDIYRAHGDLLVEAGAAYWCSCAPDRLAAMREQQRASSLPPRYNRRCLGRQGEVARERSLGLPAVLRQLVPPGAAEWTDVVRGPLRFDLADIDDSVLLKADGYPTYHLASVVDDHLMEISDVIRAEEWIPSTPKHLALHSALGWAPPRYAHVPMVLDERRQKLSKRRGARDVLDYRKAGYVPEALVNAMALLGWSPGTEEEVFSLDDLRERFTLERVNPAPAILDERRLDDLDGVHIRRLTPGALADALEPFLPGVDLPSRRALAPLLHERMVTLADGARLAAPLVGEAPQDEDVAFPPAKVDGSTAWMLLDACVEEVRTAGVGDPTGLRQRLATVLDARGVKPRDGFRVLYIAILGTPAGVPVFDAMAFLGAERSLERLIAARERLRATP